MEQEMIQGMATAAFGLEGLVASELKRLQIQTAAPVQGGVPFIGNLEQFYLANLRLRFADRVMMVLGEKTVRTFEELFQLVGSIPWERMIPVDGQINVSGKCVRSQLMSVRDCQAITKKAIIERLRRYLRAEMFPEDGVQFPIQVSIHGDLCRISLDTTGNALHRRGYRTWNGEAPLRETLAAALVELSPWRPGMPLYDPCCGTGTLLIEAALRMGHRAPGMDRAFACDRYSFFPKDACQALRASVQQDFQPERIHSIAGSDVVEEPLELARRHVRQAGLEGWIGLQRLPLEKLRLEGPAGVFLCNPPYGERLGDQESCRALYREMGKMLKRHPGWSLCVISSDAGFERAFRRRADKRRRLYNGRLECELLTFMP